MALTDWAAFGTSAVAIFGSVQAYAHSRQTRVLLRSMVRDVTNAHLTSEPIRHAIGRMVRSVAKDALQDVTEAAGVPFVQNAAPDPTNIIQATYGPSMGTPVQPELED